MNQLMGTVKVNIVIKSGKLLCPIVNGGCGNDIFVAGILNFLHQSKVYLDCTKCGYRMSFPIDRINFVEGNTGPLEIVKDDHIYGEKISMEKGL